jgi:hypothetical protein
MSRRIIIPDFMIASKSHADQLRSQADSLLECMRTHINDPDKYKKYAESFKVLCDLINRFSDDVPTDSSKVSKSEVDLSGFE